jgi:hypothetical protein
MENSTLKTETINCPNENLQELLLRNNFQNHGARGTKWKLKINNESNCQFIVYLHLLNGNEVVRVSVGHEEEPFINAVDLIETKSMDKINKLLNTFLAPN